MLTALALLFAQSAYRAQFPLPDTTVPAGLGVNIHFVEPFDNVRQIAEAGFRWVRTDFTWAQTEPSAGSYTFSEYDHLVAALKANHMRAILILDYGNPIYQEGSPRSEEARAAFVRWVHAALQHFRHKGIVWEMYNEPNIKFWKPAPNVAEYAALANEVGVEIRQNEPDEWYVGPGVSGMDFKFLKGCFEAGLLHYWDAVSVHPYRGHRPETVLADYESLKQQIAETSEVKNVPILCSEWGYPDSQYTEESQAQFLIREYLCGLIAKVPINIWYDWSDDGNDPNAPDESHFGVVAHDLSAKMALRSVKAFVGELRGYRLSQVLSDKPYLYLLEFKKGGDSKFVAWCWDEHPELIRVAPGPYDIRQVGGEGVTAQAGPNGLKIQLGPNPVVISAQ